MTPMQEALRQILALKATEDGRAELARRLTEAGGQPEAAPEYPPASHVAHHVQRAGVPAAWIRLAMDPNDGVPMTTAREWTGADKQQFPALLFAGDVGQGKSIAAVFCALEWARTYPWNNLPTGSVAEPLVWLDSRRLQDLGSFETAAKDLLRAAEKARLTILDDAGWDGTRQAREAVAAVMTDRIERRRPTIMTTNLKGDAFKARYGEPLYDRLRAYAMIPKLAGKSLRGGK